MEYEQTLRFVSGDSWSTADGLVYVVSLLRSGARGVGVEATGG